MSTLVLSAHGSRDPRSAANAEAVADRLASLRPGLDVRLAFLELNEPKLVDVLARLSDSRRAVIAPFLLASAYHARRDIPEQIVARRRVRHPTGRCARRGRAAGVGAARAPRRLHVSPQDGDLGVIVAAVGLVESRRQCADRAGGAHAGRGHTMGRRRDGFRHPARGVGARAAGLLQRRGARRLVIAPWFLAPGVFTDEVSKYARDNDIPVAAPLGAHRLVAETLLDRYDEAQADTRAA